MTGIGRKGSLLAETVWKKQFGEKEDSGQCWGKGMYAANLESICELVSTRKLGLNPTETRLHVEMAWTMEGALYRVIVTFLWFPRCIHRRENYWAAEKVPLCGEACLSVFFPVSRDFAIVNILANASWYKGKISFKRPLWDNLQNNRCKLCIFSTVSGTDLQKPL